MLWGWQHSSRSSGLRSCDAYPNLQLPSSCLEETLLPFSSNSPFPLAPSQCATEHQRSCRSPHRGATRSVPWHGQQQDNTFVGLSGKERRMGLVLCAYVPHPAGWPCSQWDISVGRKPHPDNILCSHQEMCQPENKTKTTKATQNQNQQKNLSNKKQKLSLGPLKRSGCKQMPGEE